MIGNVNIHNSLSDVIIEAMKNQSVMTQSSSSDKIDVEQDTEPIIKKLKEAVNPDKPKVKKEFDPLDYHNMTWLHKKKKVNPYYGRDNTGKIYFLMDVLPDKSKVGNDEYFKVYREKIMSSINGNIDLGGIDLSKVPPKALAYLMDVLFRDKVWGVIAKKADEKIKATSFDDCILALTYNNVNFSFDFKNGKYTLATTATD